MAAGVVSVLVARGTLGVLTSFLPYDLRRNLAFSIDTPVLLFAAVASLGTSLLFGLLPAVHSTRPDLLAITKLITVFDTYDSEKEALASFAAPSA